ncbi:LysE family translocator [Stappia stellulata]|uniref:LysE family translocator n=1 Tax=Stappia stellulata TaxID=71235 RepID=UPI001CD6CEA1|nr:LysE family translocator [Stappia stellulata]MCA1244288.1 LysE family translocator [Stappia stellulata]|eukprot:jgi/Tetstr1/437141/TSEL_025901.t1
MELSALAVFALSLMVMAAIPGPGIAAIVARVLAHGREGAMAFCLGVALGDVIWLGFAVAGLAVVAKTFGVAFLVIKYLGAAYLLYLAWKMWTASGDSGLGGVPRPRTARPFQLMMGGLAVTMGNPKVMVFYLALLPNIIALETVTMIGYLELSLVTLAVLALVLGAYCVLADRARRLISSPRAVRLLNRFAGSVMAGAAVAVATR